ncbi:MAG: amidophosphoribosyltransferase [Desulfurococcaceae archaeon]
MCGIVAVYGPRDYVGTFFTLIKMLINLQHRGQEGFGISVLHKDGSFRVIRTTMTPTPYLDRYKFKLTNSLSGVDAVGGVAHTRYSTTGVYDYPVQPVLVKAPKMKFSLVFNGTITNYVEILNNVREERRSVEYTPVNRGLNDAVALSLLMSRLMAEHKYDVVEAMKDLPLHVTGAYNVIVFTNEPRLVVAKDPRGFHPLVYSYKDGELYVASENISLEVMDLTKWFEVKPGEVLSYDGHGLEAHYMNATVETTPCVFEYIYFSRPDTTFNDVSVYEARFRMGRLLAEVAPVNADVVVPIPEGGRIIALGYSKKTGIEVHEGLIINRYLGRGFIVSPARREAVTSLKYGIVGDVVNGKRVVLIDDSIVRGTTLKHLIKRLKERGAREVHVRIASPPFKCPCFMGIDVASTRELIYDTSGGEVAKELGADSVVYNTLDNVVKAVGLPSVCHACFSCNYPFQVKQDWFKVFEQRCCI